MKNFLLIMTAVIVFSMAGCASFMDDVVMGTFRAVGNDFNQTVSLIGTWRNDETGLLTTYNSDGTITQQLRNTTNNSIVTSSGSTWKTDGNKLTITAEGSSVGVTVTFNITDNKLTLQYEGMVITFTRR
ncbi:MAG: hypothetical protein LBI28_04015 [Treponema sp.]|nr:hypothetical protein [Treponema sp.]